MGKLVARGVALVLLASVLVWLLLEGRKQDGPVIVSGLLECQEVRVGSRIGGRVASVHVTEGDEVAAGALLVSLEPFDLDDRLTQARADLGALEAEQARLEAGSRQEEIAQARAVQEEAQASLDELKAGPRSQEIKTAKAALALAEADLELASSEKGRAARLVESGAMSNEILDAAVSRWKAGLARRESQREQLELLEEGTRKERIRGAEARVAAAAATLQLLTAGARKEDRERARYRVEAARARVAALERAREELNVRAPLASVVTALDLVPGDLVAPNAPVMALRDPTSLWVRAYVPSTYLPLVSEGTQLSVVVDGLSGRELPGTVGFVAQQAEFTPSNVQTPEERAKQVFRIKVYLDPKLAGGALRTGMNADVILARTRG